MVGRTMATVAVVAVLASGCTTSGAPRGQGSASAALSGTPRAAAASSATQPAAAVTVAPAWQSVLGQVSADGSVGTATALQAFALAFGPLPGVAMPAGSAGMLPDATGPLRWLVGHWPDLTAAQREAAGRLLPQPGAPTASGRSSVALGQSHSMMAVGAAYQPVKAYQQQRSDFFYTQAALQAAADISAKVGRPLGIPVTAHVNGLVAKYEADTGVYSASNGYTGTPARCSITLSVAGDQLDGANLDLMLHHEVWHCFEATVIGLAAYWDPKWPQWIIEGEAEWVGTTSSPSAGEAGQFWPPYLTAPQKRVFSRAYDAVGFYAQLAQSGTDVWSRLIPVLQAGGNAAAYTASGAGGDPFLDAWAAGYFRDASRGAPWDIVAPGATSAKPTPRPLTAPQGSTVAASATPYAAAVYSVNPAGADLERFAFSGHARVSDTAGHDYLVHNDLLACVNPAGCTCPNGSAAPSPPPLALTGSPIDLALSGDPTGDAGTVHGESLKDFCQPASPTGTAVGMDICALMPSSLIGSMKGRPVGAASGGVVGTTHYSCTYGFDDASIHAYLPDLYHWCAEIDTDEKTSRDRGYRTVGGFGDRAEWSNQHGLLVFFGGDCIQIYNEDAKIDHDGSLAVDEALFTSFHARLKGAPLCKASDRPALCP